MSQENVEIVRSLYAADARGDTAAALKLLDPAIEIEYRGQLIDKNLTYHGPAGLFRVRQSIFENFEDFRIEGRST